MKIYRVEEPGLLFGWLPQMLVVSVALMVSTFWVIFLTQCVDRVRP